MIEKSSLVLATAVAVWVAGSASGVAQSLGASQSAADTAVSRTLDAPVNTRPVPQKWWWDDRWFDDGQLQVPVNHEVTRCPVCREESTATPGALKVTKRMRSRFPTTWLIAPPNECPQTVTRSAEPIPVFSTNS